MTIGGRKIQTRSLAVSPTNINDQTLTFVTPSHWLVHTFLFADWQKPQILFPIWLMFVSRRQAVWTLWQSRFLTWWNSTTLCSFHFNSILYFPWNPGCVQIYLLSCDSVWSSQMLVSFKYSIEGKKLSPRVKILWTRYTALSGPRPLRATLDWVLLSSPCLWLVAPVDRCGPWCPLAGLQERWVRVSGARAKYAD